MTRGNQPICAVVTWFHPPSEALARLGPLAAQCDRIVVVDNTTASGRKDVAAQLDPSILYLPQSRNRGLAGALNSGMAALPEGTTQVLFLDQDSAMPDDAVERLSRHLGRPDVAVAAPLPFDQTQDRPLRPGYRRRGVRDVDAVITSGMLVRVDALRSVGPFREDFFVDGVDQDMCLRLRQRGWRILQDDSILLLHELGSTRWRRVCGITFRTTNHPEWRLYGAARNGVVLLREHASRAPRWGALQCLQLVYWVLTIALFEHPRRARLSAFGSGLVAGLVGRPVDWETRSGRSTGGG